MSRRSKAGNPRPPRRSSGFSIETEPLSSGQRDTQRLDNSRRRAVLERKKDSFRTCTYRSEPTLGEEDLGKHSKSFTSFPIEQESDRTNYAGKEEQVRTLVPDYFFYIQDFHHYRNDIEKLILGRTVPYLLRGKGSDESGAKTAHGTKISTEQGLRQGGTSGRSGYFGALPTRGAHKSAPERIADRAKSGGSDPRRAFSGQEQAKKSDKLNRNPCCSRRGDKRYEGGEATRAPRYPQHPQEKRQLEQEQQQQQQQRRQRAHSASMPRASFQSIQSEMLPPPGPVSTPDAGSRRSSVATFLTSLDEQFVNAEGSTLSGKNNCGSPSAPKLYFPPFVPRFPCMKAAETDSRKEGAKRDGRSRSPGVPAWQQYRVLCDAFRPAQNAGDFASRSHGSSQGRPRFATSYELQYYFDVLRDANTYQLSCQ